MNQAVDQDMTTGVVLPDEHAPNPLQCNVCTDERALNTSHKSKLATLVCKQKHTRRKRADACKHKRWCEICDALYTNLHNHMGKTHGGWPCLKGCNKVYKGQDGKRRRDNCPYKPICCYCAAHGPIQMFFRF